SSISRCCAVTHTFAVQQRLQSEAQLQSFITRAN
ncbi:hypothetical protein, partial [Klebsiella pneumoniae]